MTRPPRLARRLLRALLPDAHRDVVAGDLDEEFSRHIAGTRTPAAARIWYWRQALRSLWPALRLRLRGSAAALARDARHAARLLWRTPGFTAVVTVTLALGVAATTAVVSVASAILLRPLPYDAPDRLVAIAEIDTRRETPTSGNLSVLDFTDFARLNHSFASMAGFSGGSRTINLPDTAFRVSSVEVSEQFFATLGVPPLLGRDFSAADMLPSAPLTVILGHRTWALRFNRDAGIVGRSVILSGAPATIIGVLPPSFEFPLRGLAELWLPLRPTPAQAQARQVHWFETIGRLKPGVTPAQAQADLSAIARGFADAGSRAHDNAAASVVNLSQRIAGDARLVLIVLVGAAACLLLVACANLGGLLLARVSARRQEAAIRVALGARRSQLFQQSLIETALLTLPALALGLAAGHVLVRVFVAAIPLAQRAALPHLLDVELDPLALLISSGATLVIALLFGVVPALRASHAPATWQRRGVVGGTRRDHRARAWLVGIEMALALMLVSGAGLLLASVTNLLAVSPGFNPSGVLSFRVSLPAKYLSPEAFRQFHGDALTALGALPGVLRTATISQLPLGGAGTSGPFVIDDDPSRTPYQALMRTVSTDYFDAMEVPTRHGRVFQPGDRPSGPRVAVVNQRLAEAVFAGRAIGKRIRMPFFGGDAWWDIVGVVGDEQFDALDRGVRPVVYLPYQQAPQPAFSVVMRTATEPAGFGEAARGAISRLDAQVPIFVVQTMEQIVGESPAVFRRRGVLTLIGVFALAALALAALGLYGIVAQSVSERTREIGVRMSLGATRRNIAGSVVGRSMLPVVAGAVIGIVGSVATARAIDALLFGIASGGVAPIIAMATAALLPAVLIACLIPARRATRIDPVNALRAE